MSDTLNLEFKRVEEEVRLDIRDANSFAHGKKYKKLISRSFHTDENDAKAYAEAFCKAYLAGEPTPFHI